MPRINLSAIPELKELSIVTNQEELSCFLRKLRQDHYSPEKLKDFKFSQKLTDWLKSRKPNTVTFFAVYNEEDDHAKNDGWGHYDLFRCIAVRGADGNVYLFKTLIKRFEH